MCERRFASLVSALILCLTVLTGPISAVRAAGNEGQADLDEATDAMLGAKSLEDLDKVCKLCERSLDKGLDKDNAEVAKKLYSGALLQRATMFTSAIFDRTPPSPQWPLYRRQALNDLDKSLKYDPDQASSNLTIARLELLPNGDHKHALAAANEAIRLGADDGPTKSKALVIRANLEEDSEKRAADYNEAVKLAPSDPDVLRSRGLFLLLEGKNEEAAADFAATIKLDPKDSEAHEARGVALLMLKKYDEALASFDTAIELTPRAAVARMNRARIRALQGDYKAAIEDLTIASRLDPENTSILLMRARVYQQAGEPDKAKADVEEALKQRPGYSPALQLRAILFAGAGEFGQAISDLEELRKVAPKNTDLLVQLGMLCAAAKQPHKAAEAYGAAIAQDDKNWSALRGRADADLAIGKHAEAVEDYNRAVQLHPKDSSILNNLAWVLATTPDDKLRDGKRAVTLATEACQLTDYKQAHILSTLAAGYAETGDFESAVKWSQKAVEIANADMKEQLTKELASYQAKKPLRELLNEEDQTTQSAQRDTPKVEERK